MNSKTLAKICVDAVMELARSSLSRDYADAGAVLLDLPTEPGLTIALLHSTGGAGFSLVLLRGEDAQRGLDKWMRDGAEATVKDRGVDHIGIGLVRMKDLTPPFLRILERAGYPPSRMAPFIVVRSQGQSVRPPQREEIETILYAVRGLQLAGLQLAAKGERIEGSYDMGILPRLRVSGDLRKPEVAVDLLDLATGQPVSLESFHARPGYVDPYALADDDDLEAWVAADLEVLQKLIAGGFDESLRNKKALRLYFGDEPWADPVEDDLTYRKISYFEWFQTEYRAHDSSQTVFEKVLEAETNPIFRVVLEAHRASWASIFLVIRSVPQSHVEVVDLISGKEHRIDDVRLASGSEEGLLLVMRAYRLGDFLFAKPLGPVLMSSWDIQMFEELEQIGLQDTPEGYQRDMHLLGRLWGFNERMTAAVRGGAVPTLTNTDGHPLLLHKASFSVADPDALTSYCEQREDLEFDAVDADWTWLRKDGTCLGSCKLLDDHLLLEVNSEQRYEEARRWLNEIPGLRFESLTTRSLDMDTLGDLPLDDRLQGDPPPALSPEAIGSLEEFMHEKHMSWLDEDIPALGGKTPRETCATQEGRRKVRRMILGYRDSPGSPPIRVPREDMLKELGLEPDTGDQE